MKAICRLSRTSGASRQPLSRPAGRPASHYLTRGETPRESSRRTSGAPGFSATADMRGPQGEEPSLTNLLIPYELQWYCLDRRRSELRRMAQAPLRNHQGKQSAGPSCLLKTLRHGDLTDQFGVGSVPDSALDTARFYTTIDISWPGRQQSSQQAVS
ncbi:hypothetical protein RRG08_061369 [Elysia crispata]|uniref:Uncharacterized protein n=1 Tax=Elysia crispata TaxID=231223 RepID=A0AAE1AFB6_9GAST|nr:hypothetical protein RRG08_061369 [Elysia crispata]